FEWGAEQMRREGLDIAFRYPRRAQVGVDLAGQHILGLDGAQGVDIAGIGAASAFGGVQLGAHIARQIDIRGVPDLGGRVLVDEVAQLRDDLVDWRPVQRGDVWQIHYPRWSRETSNPSSALCTVVLGVCRPTTSWCRMAAFSARPVRSS